MKKNYKARLVAAVIALAFACGPAALSAVAQGPPEDVNLVFEFGEGEACAFPVRLELSGKEKIMPLPGDRLMVISPGLTGTFTNLDDSSKRTTQIITGAIQVIFLESGGVELVVTGRNFLGLFDPDLPPLAITVGVFSFSFDDEGNLVQPPSGKGRVIDVCELIQ